MPAVFIGHGSPMNALDNNTYSMAWSDYGQRFADTYLRSMADRRAYAKPKAVLAISAHWYVGATMTTAATEPPTIHDFGGFPDQLFQVQYPAPGFPALAQKALDQLRAFCAPAPVLYTKTWGLDHGTWSVLKHVFPDADVPVVQLSIDASRPAAWHFAAGRLLRKLRDDGYLIMGSGNIVHNLGAINWSDNATPHPSSIGFHDYVVEALNVGDTDALVNYKQHPHAAYAVPTPEHYLPLLYVLGAAKPGEKPEIFVDGYEYASLSMLSVAFG
jgi:4,5-DOPA dioxygenase extradiol